MRAFLAATVFVAFCNAIDPFKDVLIMGAPVETYQDVNALQMPLREAGDKAGLFIGAALKLNICHCIAELLY